MTDLVKCSDIKLCKLQGQTYEQIFIQQAYLRMIQAEIEKRTPKVEVVIPEPTA